MGQIKNIKLHIVTDIKTSNQTNNMMKYLLLLAFVACIYAMPMRNELVVRDVDGAPFDDGDQDPHDEGERRDGCGCCNGGGDGAGYGNGGGCGCCNEGHSGCCCHEPCCHTDPCCHTHCHHACCCCNNCCCGCNGGGNKRSIEDKTDVESHCRFREGSVLPFVAAPLETTYTSETRNY